MNKFFIVAAFLVSSSAFACPNLAGNYVCQDDGQPMRTTVAQSVVDGVTQYSITTGDTAWSPVVTDGVERDFAGIEQLQQARYTAVCEGNVVAINAKGKVMEGGAEIGNLALRILASVDANGNLVQNVNGTLSGSFGEFPIDEQNNVCTRD